MDTPRVSREVDLRSGPCVVRDRVHTKVRNSRYVSFHGDRGLPSPLRFRFISHRALSLAPADSAPKGLPAEAGRAGSPTTKPERRKRPFPGFPRCRRSVHPRDLRPEIEDPTTRATTTGERMPSAVAHRAGGYHPPRSSDDRRGPRTTPVTCPFKGQVASGQILQLLRAFLRTYFAPCAPPPRSPCLSRHRGVINHGIFSDTPRTVREDSVEALDERRRRRAERFRSSNPIQPGSVVVRGTLQLLRSPRAVSTIGRTIQFLRGDPLTVF